MGVMIRNKEPRFFGPTVYTASTCSYNSYIL